MAVEITLANEIRVPRSGEWLCRGIPFPQGILADPGNLILKDQTGRVLPLGTEPMARWPDGTVKWALLQFPVDFDRNGRKTYSLNWVDEKPEPDAGPRISLTKTAAGLEVDNGVLSFVLPGSGQAFLAGCRRGNRECIRSVTAEIEDDTGVTFVSHLEGEPRIERITGKMLVVSRRGVHRDAAGRKLFSLVFRVTVFAGADDLEVEYQFIHDEPYREVPERLKRAHGIGTPSVDLESPRLQQLRAVRLIVAHAINGADEYATCPFATVGNRGLITSVQPIRGLLTEAPRTALYDAMIDAEVDDGETQVGRSHGWISAGDGRGGVAASVRKFVQQWPKGFAADASKIVLDLWPEAAGPLAIFQGQAKSHQVKLRAYAGGAAEARLPDWHFAYQFPIVFSSPDWFIDSGALGPVFRYQPGKYMGIEQKFRLEFEQFLGYDRRLGMMDYGDYEQLMSASWGRVDFMANCEHDFGQTVYLQFVRTGSYLYLDAFEAAVRHVMDLDIIHFDDHFDELGGWTAHGAYHVGADGKPNCHLSHMWAEGFLSYYYYSGYTPALESARGVADLICRKVAAGDGRRGARDRGWPLIALCSVYRATGERRYAEAAERIAASFSEGPDPLEPNGGCSGGWGPIPYQQAVMGSIAATGLAYHFQTFGNSLSRDSFLKLCDFLASEDVRTPEGLYLSMPGNETPMSYIGFSALRESIGFAWEITGDEKYVHAGLRDIEMNMISNFPSVGHFDKTRFGYEVIRATGDSISVIWRDLLRFFDYADRAGLLRDF